VDDIDEVDLRGHDCVDGFVGSRSLVDHVGVFAALDAGGHTLVVLDGEAADACATKRR